MIFEQCTHVFAYIITHDWVLSNRLDLFSDERLIADHIVSFESARARATHSYSYESSISAASSLISGGLFKIATSVRFIFVQNQLFAISLLAGILYSLSKLFSQKIFDLAKKAAYECGFEPFLLTKTGIEVGFVLVGFIFLIFDLELIFLVAFIVAVGSIGAYGIMAGSSYVSSVWMMVIVEIKTGVLSWPVWNIYKVN